VLLAAFAVIEVRSTHALLPIRVLRSRDRTRSYLRRDDTDGPPPPNSGRG
jgi:hypothetical protein